jgi:hypothetical protein
MKVLVMKQDNHIKSYYPLKFNYKKGEPVITGPPPVLFPPRPFGSGNGEMSFNLVFGVTLVAKHPLIGCKLGGWTIIVGCLPLGIRPSTMLQWCTGSTDRGVVASDVLPALGNKLVPLVEAKRVQKTRSMCPVAGEARYLIRR